MARRLALLIGNQSFDPDSKFEPLRGPHNDVDALAAVLRDSARGGFTEVRPIKDARHRDLVPAVRRILREATKDDEVLIHYSGHGQPDEDGRLFLAAADSHAEELAATALRATDLQEWMARSPARSVVMLLDCCYAGAFGKVLTGSMRGRHAAGIQQQFRDMVASGRFILTSSTSWQTSQEAEGETDGVWMGRFTRSVIERLNDEVGDTAGWVRFSDLAAHVRSVFPGQDPRAFHVDADGDPLIARVVPRQTAAERAAAVLGRWWHEERLTQAQFRALVAIVTGDSAAPQTRRFVELLADSDVTPGEVLIAWGGFAAPVAAGQGGATTRPSVAPMRFAPEVGPNPTGQDGPALSSAGGIGLSRGPLPAIHPAFPPLTDLARWREPVSDLPEAAWPDMVTLPAGVFTMGAPNGEDGSDDVERPQRQVTVPRPFALGRTAVTFAMWDAARAAGADLWEASDEGWGRDQRPVIYVSWESAQAYCAWLNQRLGLRPGTYRLPSEAEWEYACRSGTVTSLSFGGGITTQHVNHFDGRGDRARGRTVPVGTLPANHWGLHEMHGNVWEWCEDAYGPYPNNSTDSRPLIRADASPHVLRGGAWNSGPRDCRSARRIRRRSGTRYNYVGFRLARALF